MPISDELKAVYATAPVVRTYIETLTLEHPEFSGGFRYLTNQRDGWQAYLSDLITNDLVDFEYVPFAVVPPQAEGDGAISLQVAIDNCDRVLMDELEILSVSPTIPIILTYRVYLSDDNTTVQNDPPMVLDITSVTATQFFITFNAGLTNLRNRPFPSKLYTVDKFRGLAR
jgi:hypothetical protein